MDRMARALVPVINILDPGVRVFGGDMSNMARPYENMPKVWDRHVFSDKVETGLLVSATAILLASAALPG